jgi:hypothetical protein
MSKASYPFIARGNQRYNIARSETFNIDNGGGTTIDDVLFANLPTDAKLVSVQAVYVEATATAGAASANFTLGITAGGATIVGSTALAVSTAVGGVTAGTILIDTIAAGSTLFCRHTGVATTVAGQYYLQVVYMLKP